MGFSQGLIPEGLVKKKRKSQNLHSYSTSVESNYF